MDSDTKPTKKIDYSPLTSRVSWQDASDFMRQWGMFGRPKTGSQEAIPSGVVIFSTIVIGVILFVWFLVMLAFVPEGGRLPILFFIICIPFGVVAAAQRLMAESRAAIRVKRFTERNNLQFLSVNQEPPYKGLLFNDKVGSSRFASNIIYSTTTSDVVDFEIGKYSYTTGSGKSRQQHNWIYIRMKMDRNLPHIVLDAKANNSRLFGAEIGTNLPLAFTKDQILHLEGDFDKYFTLYAPKEYEDDALYVFAPDVMALLIDESRQLDAEIVGDEAYFYLQIEPGIGLDNPDLMQRLIGIVTTLGNKLHSETERYMDDHVASLAAGSVANAGRSLKGTTWTPIAIVNTAIVAIIFILFAIVVMYQETR